MDARSIDDAQRATRPHAGLPIVLGLGAGGHARSVLDAILASRGARVIGLLDPDPRLQGHRILEVPVLGDDSLVPALRARGADHFFVGRGGASDNGPRRRLFERALAEGLEPLSVRHPWACVSPHARCGPGSVVLAGAIVGAGARLGDNALVNTGAIVEHDCTLEGHAHVATGAVLCGGVQVGFAAHVGAGAAVREGVRIGAGAVVGAGSVVLDDVPPRAIVAGIPARRLEARA